MEEVDYISWTRGEVKLEIISPIQKEIPCITLPHSPPTEMEGTIIDMGDGAPSDFDQRAADIDGKIVMTNSLIHPGGNDGFTGEKSMGAAYWPGLSALFLSITTLVTARPPAVLGAVARPLSPVSPLPRKTVTLFNA